MFIFSLVVLIVNQVNDTDKLNTYRTLTTFMLALNMARKLWMLTQLDIYIYTFFCIIYSFDHQKINYENYFAKKGPEVSDPGGTNYRNLNLTGKRLSSLPMTMPNPMFADGKNILIHCYTFI